MKLRWLINMKVIAALFTSIAIATAAFWLSGNHAALKPTKTSHALGKPWNGGKSQGPLAIESDLDQKIAANEETPLHLALRFESECESVRISLRGLDGLSIVSGGGPVDLGPCRIGETVNHQVVVRAPEGVEGLLVVDSSVRAASDDEQENLERMYSQALILESAGTRKPKTKAVGRLSKASGRAPLVELGSP